VKFSEQLNSPLIGVAMDLIRIKRFIATSALLAVAVATGLTLSGAVSATDGSGTCPSAAAHAGTMVTCGSNGGGYLNP
jgi:hypothetical protein